MKILRGILSPIGKALHLDMASFQKTRGSVAKVKMQKTKPRPHHIWLGFDEKHDENGDGRWLDVQYENIPEYTSYCKDLAHKIQTCPVRQKDKENKKKKNNPKVNKEIPDQQNISENQPKVQNQQIQKEKHNKEGKDNNVRNHQNSKKHQTTGPNPLNDEWQTQRKRHFKGASNQQESNKNEEKTNAQCVDAVSANPTHVEKSASTICQELPQPDSPEISQPQKPLKPKQKPSQKKRRAMKRKGTNTIQHSADSDNNVTLPKEQPQNPGKIPRFEDENTSRAEGYRDKGIDNPSLQPLVNKRRNLEEKGAASSCEAQHQ
ncbi:uncharacterized protein [Nicotiana tomentosiformis]|uniref:uncharacterized protein n=1 Tax=Nicotiana tomentosiformis TaxID=4098 RepID=UPI00388CAD36